MQTDPTHSSDQADELRRELWRLRLSLRALRTPLSDRIARYGR